MSHEELSPAKHPPNPYTHISFESRLVGCVNALVHIVRYVDCIDDVLAYDDVLVYAAYTTMRSLLLGST